MGRIFGCFKFLVLFPVLISTISLADSEFPEFPNDDSQEVELFDAGFLRGMNTRLLSQKYLISPEVNSVDAIAKYLSAHGGDPVLAKKMVIISQCLGISVPEFVGMVQQESRFKANANEGNGIGLTQMTPSGIQEVNDQLGARGIGLRATDAAVEYFRGSIHSCIAPKLWKGVQWVDIWARKQGTTMSAMKRQMLNADTNLVYGAILLKVYLAYQHSINPRSNIRNIYSAALFQYNSVFRKYPLNVAKFASKIRNDYAHTSKAAPDSL